MNASLVEEPRWRVDGAGGWEIQWEEHYAGTILPGPAGQLVPRRFNWELYYTEGDDATLLASGWDDFFSSAMLSCERAYNEFRWGEYTAARCECGKESHGFLMHSPWCPMAVKS